jgi:Glycosyltransferase family 87
MLLSLLLLKPQTVWLVPVVLLAMRRWRALWGVAAGAGAGVALSLAVLGVGQCLAWLPLLSRDGSDYIAGSSSIPGLAALLAGPRAGFATAAAAALVATVAAFRFNHRLREQPELAVATFVSLSLVLSPHVGGADLVLVTPSLALAARSRPLLATLAAVALSLSFVPDLSYVPPLPVTGCFGLAIVAGAAAWVLLGERSAAMSRKPVGAAAAG